MKRRRIFLALLGSVASITLAILVRPREREPEYNGATLSTWLSRCGSTNVTESLAAADAIQQIGTNALPFLLSWIQYEPGWRDWLGGKLLKWPVIGTRPNVQRLFWKMTHYRAASAVTAFKILGTEARPARTELQRLANNTKAPETAIRASECLLSVAYTPDGIPRGIGPTMFIRP